MIDVNTKGIEAAAATSISIVPKFGSFKVNYNHLKDENGIVNTEQLMKLFPLSNSLHFILGGEGSKA